MESSGAFSAHHWVLCHPQRDPPIRRLGSLLFGAGFDLIAKRSLNEGQNLQFAGLAIRLAAVVEKPDPPIFVLFLQCFYRALEPA
jgi:hypothetical protein